MNIKKIILLSDTHRHLSNSALEAVKGDYLPEQIYDDKVFVDGQIANEFIETKEILNKRIPDLILHAGDVGAQHIIDELQGISQFKAVVGNCDFENYFTINGPLNTFEYFDYEGVKIILTHIPYDLEQWNKTYSANLYLHGHTHEPLLEKLDNGDIWICPGSASMGRYGSPNSIAAIYITSGQVLGADLIEV